jgi:hypothetical protein
VWNFVSYVKKRHILKVFDESAEENICVSSDRLEKLHV